MPESAITMAGIHNEKGHCMSKKDAVSQKGYCGVNILLLAHLAALAVDLEM